LSVGPLVTFGFLLIPPLIAHVFAANMRQFALFAAAIGIAMSLIGFCIAYRWDLPVGPTDVALLGILYAVIWTVHRLQKAFGKGGSRISDLKSQGENFPKPPFAH